MIPKLRLQTPWVAAAAIGAAVLLYGAWMLHRHFSDPALVFLTDESRAKWICHDEPVDLKVHGAGPVIRAFRTRFTVARQPAEGVLRIRALKRWNVLLDGKVVGGTDSDLLHWKTEHQVQLTPLLSVGEHELRIYVQNETGPVAVRAGCDALALWTNAAWESTQDEKVWTPARLASIRPPARLSRQFEPVSAAFAAKLPVLASVFVVVAAATLYWSRTTARAGIRISPATVRWIVVVLWVVLGANNILRLPAPAGFDVSGHLDYIAYLINHQRVPLATDGWQMFQSPLYYTIAAPFYLLLAKIVSAAKAPLFLRAISLLAGAVQIELSYRATRLVFPERRDLQILGTIFAGLVPMNIYLSQYVGNEPLASCFGSLVVLLCLRQLVNPGSGGSATRSFAVIGIALGLALLTKFSAVILVAPLLFLLAYRFVDERERGQPAAKRIAVAAAVVVGVATLLAGWYYLRNWIHLGRPFVGGWDANRGIPWWQDPGYRMAGDLLKFGEGLAHPIYAGVVSFWDGVYATFWCDSFISSAVDLPFRPPWNYSYLLPSVWLALIPTAAILVGSLRGLRGGDAARAGAPLLFAVVCVAAYLGALLHHFLTQPSYSAVKAFYTLGAMPCYTLLGVAGFDLMGRNGIVRALLYGGVAAWAVSVYLAYFAR